MIIFCIVSSIYKVVTHKTRSIVQIKMALGKFNRQMGAFYADWR